MNKKTLAYAKGQVQGIRESGWVCGDCGNVYDAGVEHCPNQLLDEATIKLRQLQLQQANARP